MRQRGICLLFPCGQRRSAGRNEEAVVVWLRHNDASADGGAVEFAGQRHGDGVDAINGERFHCAGLRLGLVDEGLRHLHEHIRQRLIGARARSALRTRLQPDRGSGYAGSGVG